MLSRYVQLHPLHRPRLPQTQQLPVQLRAFHRASPCRKCATAYPLTHTNV
jgi:hypothetical protein